MYCRHCGAENLENAKYCKNCGRKLLKNQINISKAQKPELSQGDQKNGKWIFLIFVSLFFILLFVFLSNSINQNSSNGMTSDDIPVETYGTDNGIFYSSDHLSFSHRRMYSLDLGNNSSDFEIFANADPQGQDGYDCAFFFTVYKPETATRSALENATSDKNVNEEIGVTTYPIKRIQIAGVTGYQYDYDYIYSDPPSYTNRDIFFVKKGLLYKISFRTHLNEMDLYQSDIDKIVNSFTVK